MEWSAASINTFQFGFSTSCLFPPKLTPEPLDAPAVHTQIPDAEPRRRTNVDHAARGTETAFQIIDETEPGPAFRMEVGIRRGEDDGAGRPANKVFQSGESQDGITRHGERLDSMKAHRVVPAAHAIQRKTRTGRKLFGHESSFLKGIWERAVRRRWCHLPGNVEVQRRVTSEPIQPAQT